MKYNIEKTTSVPLSADNRKSVTLKKGRTLDTDTFKLLPDEKIAKLVKDGVLVEPGQKKKTACVA